MNQNRAGRRQTRPPVDPRIPQFEDFQARLTADIDNVVALCDFLEMAHGKRNVRILNQTLDTRIDSARMFAKGLAAILMMRVATEAEVAAANTESKGKP